MTPEELQIQNIKSHRFDAWAENLMQTPPLLDPWQQTQVGQINDCPYRTGYENMTIQDNHEPLVACPNYGLVSKDYYLNKAWDLFSENNYDSLDAMQNRTLWPFAWVRQSVAEKLNAADKLLRQHDLFLYVASGWRHPATQNFARNHATKKLGEEETKRLFATKSPHATGGAVDIELHSLQTFQNLSFSYPGDQYGFYNLEQQETLFENEEIKRNTRRILYHVLTDLGFTIHPGEFWHFGLGDPLSSYLTKQSYAIYGSTLPPENYKITHFQI